MEAYTSPRTTIHFNPQFLPHRNILPNRFLPFRRRTEYRSKRISSFLKTNPVVVKDGVLNIKGKDALVGLADNVVVTPCYDSSAFLGAVWNENSSRHVFKLGVIQDARLLSLYRFKIWWMGPRVGKSARDVPVETQMLLVEVKEEPTSEKPNGKIGYALFLPVLDGDFRSSLQGNSADELEVCVESIQSVFSSLCGISRLESLNSWWLRRILQKYSGTFALRETKQMPGMLDWFGWCTWDAFYHDVNPQGIRDGLKSLYEGGTPAKFLIIDDGWQDTVNEFQKEGEPFIEGSQFGASLISIQENHKFKKAANEDSSSKPYNLKEFISDIKGTSGLKFVYVWHAIMGYWGGLDPNAPGTKKYGPTVKFPQQSQGNLSHSRDIAMDRMEEYGVGIIDPERIFEFYDDLHGYLASQEVDGVKVDVQNILETVAMGSRGRVSLTRQFQQALEKSILKNFPDNGIICCMAQSTDSVYSSKTSAITRASDDYYPKNPMTQSLHIAAVAYNSLFFGEIVVPDWDMFYSRHDAAEFHAVARAIGGCGVYVSDKPGCHDFKILKRLVLPSGSVLRAKYPGRPSRDCLFSDPVMDGEGLLKIWNLNKLTGVLAVFNCQGAGTWPGLMNSVQADSLELSGKMSPADVDYLHETSPELGTGEFAVFSFRSGSISRLPMHGTFNVTLRTLECDIFTVSPIMVYHQDIQFAPIGLINMYNSGGAVDAVEAHDSSAFHGIRIQGRGEGVFGAYSGSEPKWCSVNTKEVELKYSSGNHFLKIDVPSGTNSWEIIVHF